MKLRLLSLAAVLMAATAFVSGCTNTDQPTTTQGYHDTFADVPSLTAGTTYHFNITGAGSGSHITGVSSYATGVVRVFWSRAAGDSSKITATSSTSSIGSDDIVWAAVNGTSSTIRLFETAAPASVGPSGLVLGTSGNAGIFPHAASLSGAEKSNIDLVLATDNTIAFPYVSLESADVAATNTRSAELGFNGSVAYQIKGGLAAQSLSTSLSTLIPSGTSANNFYDIKPAVHDSSSAIFFVRTADMNYARVEVVPQLVIDTVGSVPGHYLWGDHLDPASGKTYRYVDLNVTYNPSKNSAYAETPALRKRALIAYTGLLGLLY